MDIKLILENWIKKTLGVEGDLVLVHPKEIKNGDFTLVLNPENAEESLKKLEAGRIPEVEKLELLSGRFINIYLSTEFFGDSIKEILSKKEKFGANNLLNGEKTIIEYTDPNPFKEFHIGHLMPNVIGESIAKLLIETGAEVRRANYQGDVGLHVAKAIWGKIQNPELNWGDAYVFGSQNFEPNKEAINEINKKIYEKSDEKINALYEEGRKESLENFEKIYEILGTKFDYYFFESEVGDSGKQVVLDNLKNGIFEESDGAVVFHGEKFDPKLHTRVFINSQGLPVYEAKELALAKFKYEEYPYDKSVVITGNEINEYFKVLLEAMSKVFPELAQKTLHISHGMLRLPSGKMSSRTGDIITAESLINEVKEKIKAKIADRGFSEEEKEKIAELVAIGAIKYSILRQAVGGDIIFDFEKSISFEGDSGPYLQYTTVRAKSVLEKAKSENINIENKIPQNWQTTELERLMYRFPEIIERAASEYSPHYLVTYLTEIAGSFNAFYAQHKIIDAENPEISSYRLAITQAVSVILSNGLNLLGIKVPEKM